MSVDYTSDKKQNYYFQVKIGFVMGKNDIILKPCNVNLLPISSTFYEQLLGQNSCAKMLQSRIVTREKLPEALLNKKGACKLLMKLTPGLNKRYIRKLQ